MDHPRVRISVSEPYYRQCELAWDALVEFNEDSEVCVRGETLVRMGEGELAEFDVASMQERLSQCAAFMKGGGEDEDEVEMKPPRDVCMSILARTAREYPDVPHVDMVVDVPVVDRNREFITTTGGRIGSTVYYDPDPKVADKIYIGKVESPDELQEAKDFLLDELLIDFEFDSDSSRAHAVALMLLPFVREMIDGPTPMHVIIAPDIGAGKTLLAQSCLMAGCGFVAPTSAPSDDDEWRKRITAELMAGHPAILLDNIAGTLDSASLASALTTGKWRDRILGQSRSISIPVRNVWVATGNNAALSSEQVRRAVPIFLDPHGTRPSDRPGSAYKHKELLQWAQRNRAPLVNAAMVIVKHWLEGPAELTTTDHGHMFWRGEGSDPIRSKKTLGSFENWGYTMGGILQSIGMDGFLENRDRLVAENDPEFEERVDFLEAWFKADDCGELTHQELMSKIKYPGPLHPYAPTTVTGARNSDDKLRIWLREANHKKLGGYELRKTSTRPSKWFVRKID